MKNQRLETEVREEVNPFASPSEDAYEMQKPFHERHPGLAKAGWYALAFAGASVPIYVLTHAEQIKEYVSALMRNI